MAFIWRGKRFQKQPLFPPLTLRARAQHSWPPSSTSPLSKLPHHHRAEKLSADPSPAERENQIKPQGFVPKPLSPSNYPSFRLSREHCHRSRGHNPGAVMLTKAAAASGRAEGASMGRKAESTETGTAPGGSREAANRPQVCLWPAPSLQGHPEEDEAEQDTTPALPAASPPALCQAVRNPSLLTVLRALDAATLPPSSPSLLAPR